MKNYHPIDCNYYDRLEALATTQAVADIAYELPDGKVVVVSARIADVYSRNGEEFIRLDNDIEIRLDYIDAINGIKNPKPGSETDSLSC